jgi:hypothetical protein
MNMRGAWPLLITLGVAGCATHRATAPAATETASSATPFARDRATQVVQTPYEIRRYRDPADPAVTHEPHVIYRATRVPASLAVSREVDTLPRTAAEPVTYAPLPTSAELSAEIAKQKQITADLRAIQSNMAATQRDAQAQYGKLVSATAETLQLRQQLEEERARLKESGDKQSQQPSASPTVAANGTAAPEPKW